MKIGELNPCPTDRIQFEGWEQRVAAPQAIGCYVIASFDDDILYVGQASKINRRMKSHLIDRRKRKHTSVGVAFWLYYKICNNEHELNSLERGWVLQHRAREGALPPFNKIMPPV